MKRLLIFTISILLYPIWLFSFLRLIYYAEISVFIGLVLTFLIGKLITVLAKSPLDKIFSLTVPAVYFIAGFFHTWIFSLPSPLLLAILIFLITIFFNTARNLAFAIGFLIISWFSFYYFPLAYVKLHEEKPIDYPSITQFDFITSESDTFKFTEQNLNIKHTLFITFSEGCPSCKQLINDTNNFFNELEEERSLSSYFIYINLSKLQNKDKIKNELTKKYGAKILSDDKENFYKTYQMTGVPNLLVFDKDGCLIYNIRGYNRFFVNGYLRRFKQILG